MAWPEIDKQAKEWLLDTKRHKNREEKLIPLSDTALDVIDTIKVIKCEAQLVFTTNNKTPISGFNYAKRKVDETIARMTKGKGVIEDWTWHDFRRTCSTKLHSMGFPPHVVEALLGHKKKGVGAIYNRYDYAPEKRVALDTWARFLIDNAEGKKADVVPFTGKRA